MANTSYQTQQQITTKARRDIAYRRISDLLEHLIGFDIDLVAISYDSGTKLITFTFSSALPANQVDHLGLAGPV